MPRQCSECRSDVIKSGSNHEFEMVAKCLDSALNVEVMESKAGATMNLRWWPNASTML